ncbi:hypothetical protein [Planctomycetes bacterium TBK1r]|uniref:RecT family protein n=1 Tax=Stieleria magnilauensis TaxID=2527963 RepID=A0ABX5XYD6_9BACT|nr:hypothetical protein TBK1r_59930 [Planctomycetes bacterium TBK1r]QDV87044.1 hypothetical protein TBK1r_60710 [Planctomycetes bacterium TBK1r]
MNQLMASPETTQQPQQVNAVFDPAQFAHFATVAGVLVDSEMLPAHLRGRLEKGRIVERFTRQKQIAIATVVISAAHRYGVDLFAFAQATFIVHGKLDFDGKTYAALANSRGGLAERLSFRYIGEGDQKRCICSGRFAGEREPRELQTDPFAVCKQRGGAAWDGCDPEQQLSYAAARSWVRRYCPDVLLGLVSEFDEAEPPYVQVDATFTTSPGSVGLLEKPPNVLRLLEEMKNAPNVETLKACKDQLEADESIENAHRQEIILAGRRRQEQLGVKPKEQQPAAPSWLKDCEAILHESDDPKAIDEAWKKIDGSDEVPPADAKRLGKLFNERMKEFVQ